MPTATPDQTVNGSAHPEYDVFVSYADEDADWCDDELIKPLEAGGVKVIHKKTFALGGTWIGSEEDAIRKSRHTIAFLTPAYLEAKRQEFLVDRVLNQESTGRPLIPVMAEECELPNKLDGLVRLDFTDPAEKQQAIRRLLENLGRSAREAQEAAARTATRGIKALARLMRYRSVQKAVAKYEASFEAAGGAMIRIERLKTLHDNFQEVEASFKLVINQRKAEVPAGGPPTPAADLSDELEEAVDALTADLDLLLLSVRDSGLPDAEVSWQASVRRVRDELAAAVSSQDAAGLARPLERLQRTLGSEPAKINGQIVAGVAYLSLEGVAKELGAVRDELSRNAFDVEAQARFGEFARSVDSLGDLARHLHALHFNHNYLQRIDEALHPLKGNRRPDPQDVADLWVEVVGPVSQLDPAVGADWVGPLQRLTGRMSEAVARPPIDPAGVRHFQRQLNDFWIEMDKAFTRADTDLLHFCGQLRGVGKALLEAIRGMQNG